MAANSADGEKEWLDTESLIARCRRYGRVRMAVRPVRQSLLIGVVLLLVLYSTLHWHRTNITSGLSSLSSMNLEPMVLDGYAHPGRLNKDTPCEDLWHQDGIEMERENFDVDDDLDAIVASLKDHPMIDAHYKWAKTEITKEEVEQHWLRMAQSSVWLSHLSVYLTITRIVFYPSGVRHWSKMSFLRGQIHDSQWKELKNYTMSWEGQITTFPRIFDIPSPYILDGGFYGPEDPRVIIEEGHENAEPVIVFNMISDLEHSTRTMCIHRPFSNDTTILNINGRDRRGSEKNWMPFFYSPQATASPWPSTYIHFVYEFKPLSILKCHLLNGWCDFVYKMKVPEDPESTHHQDLHGNMRGGANFYPAKATTGHKQSWIGFPRTHIDAGCKDGFYRPALAILTATSPHDFHFDYMSGPLNFNDRPFPPSISSEPCSVGRILIANSIARWGIGTGKEDIMTLTFSVNDYTTEVQQLRGVRGFLSKLPSSTAIGQKSITAEHENDRLRWNVPSQDVLTCAVIAAYNSTETIVSQSREPLPT